jgi:alkylation response protein AidB-like acyl-CoA dehydrogenase
LVEVIFKTLSNATSSLFELWDALAKAGFLGVHISENDGGGAGNGSGLADYNVVVEETAAKGCPILSLVIGSIRRPDH